MPILVNLDKVILKWQSDHNERLTYTDLAWRAGISLATFNRIKANKFSKADLDKINRLCKVLECEPGDLLKRVETNFLPDDANPGAHDKPGSQLGAADPGAQEFQQLLSEIEDSDPEEE